MLREAETKNVHGKGGFEMKSITFVTVLKNGGPHSWADVERLYQYIEGKAEAADEPWGFCCISDALAPRLAPGVGAPPLLRNTVDWWLDNGIELVMGRTNNLKLLKQYSGIYNKVLSEKSGNMDSVDLRYTNGFSVHWKDNHLPQNKIQGG